MDKKEFVRRRKRLMEMMDENSVAIIPTAPEHVRNRDVLYPFRADSDFHYLTGFPEPLAVAVLVPNRKHGEYVLFCRESDKEQETWHGRRSGLEGACDYYGADDAFPIEDMDDILPNMLEDRDRIFYTMGVNADFDLKVTGWVNQVRSRDRSGITAPGEFVSLDHQVHEMRLYKTQAEIKAMREAARIAAKAHCRAMRCCKPGLYEYQLEAEYLHEFLRSGARSPAYPSIVGGGENACILHYVDNNAKLKNGDLVLIDAGAEYENYASDITRTFPTNGKFTTNQRLIYELVLKGQAAAIEKVQPGNHWNEPHEAAVKVITTGLVELGILKGRVNKLIRDEAYKKFYMHRTGHWLGLDVHDVGDYKVAGEWRMFEPGMVLTVEPGIYLPASTKRLAKKWWNIGIRVEDDVLVTKDGHEVLSAGVPKAVDEIEALMSQRRVS